MGSPTKLLGPLLAVVLAAALFSSCVALPVAILSPEAAQADVGYAARDTGPLICRTTKNLDVIESCRGRSDSDPSAPDSHTPFYWDTRNLLVAFGVCLVSAFFPANGKYRLPRKVCLSPTSGCSVRCSPTPREWAVDLCTSHFSTQSWDLTFHTAQHSPTPLCQSALSAAPSMACSSPAPLTQSGPCSTLIWPSLSSHLFSLASA